MDVINNNEVDMNNDEVDINNNEVDIDYYYEQYLADQEKEKPTEKQLEFFQSVLNDVTENGKLTERILIRFGEDETRVLQETIDNLETLTKTKLTKLLNKLRPMKLVSEKQIEALERFMKLELIKDQYNVNSFSELTHGQYSQIMKNLFHPGRFSLTVVDHPLISEFDYEIGYQTSDLCEDKKMFYLKFYNLMMLDYDYPDGKKEDTLKKLIEMFREFSVRIYETHNGFHVFILSYPIDHDKDSTYNLMMFLGCDKFYCLFTRKHGYKIRLSPKIGRDENFVAKFVHEHGDNILPELKRLMIIHDLYINTGDSNLRRKISQK